MVLRARTALLDLPASLKQRYRAQAEGCSLQFLYDALAITTQCEAGYKAAINQRLHIEFALMKLAFLSKGVPSSTAAASAGSRTASDPSHASVGPSLSRAEGGTSLLDPLPTGLTAETVGALYEVQTFYEKMFLEQGYKITYLSFVINHDGPYEHPTDFDEDYWRSVEGPRLLFGHDSAEI